MNRTKKEIILKSAAALLLIAATATAAERAFTMRVPSPGDLVARELVAAPLPVHPATDERQPVAFSWAVEPRATLTESPLRLHAESREYWQRVSAAELARGVELFTTAPGALVRVQPAGAEPEKRSLAPQRFTLEDARGRRYTGGEAMDQLAGAEELAAAGSPLGLGTSAFRLAAELGAGRFVLRLSGAPAMAPATEYYVVHVFDAGSDLALAVDAPRAEYLAGETLTVAAFLRTEAGRVAASAVDGFVTSPTGRVLPVRFRRAADSAFQARLPLALAGESGADGLWEVVAAARGVHQGQAALRTVRGAFALAAPTARLTGEIERRFDPARGLELRVGVEVAAAGRYELRGVVYGDVGGDRAPLAVAHAAGWLEPGRGELALAFDPTALAGFDPAAPFELRFLELRDQTRLALLERRQRAADLAP